MSRVEIEHPLALPSRYTQGMLLSLLWVPSPKRAFMLGFGGGKIPLLLYHLFPDCRIESVDIDPLLPEVATQFFGITFDERQKLLIEDGREFLEAAPTDARYDYLFLDAYRGLGFNPLHLNTVEFFELCKCRLTPDGVVSMNLLTVDPLFGRKLGAVAAVFPHVFLLRLPEAVVVLASEQDITQATLLERAAHIDHALQPPFPLATLAQELIPLKQWDGWNWNAAPLTDSNCSTEGPRTVQAGDAIFFGAQTTDPCPCGSGKTYGDCHAA